MGDFAPIETQEELDALIGERLRREREKYAGYLSPDEAEGKYGGYLSPEDEKKKYGKYLSPDEAERRYAEKYAGYLSPEAEREKYGKYLSPDEAEKKDALIKSLETSAARTRVAIETGIPLELAERISGETEDEMRDDAKRLAGFVGTRRSAVLKSTEPESLKADTRNAAYKKMLGNINKSRGGE